jgi:hypothetical protein
MVVVMAVVERVAVVAVVAMAARAVFVYQQPKQRKLALIQYTTAPPCRHTQRTTHIVYKVIHHDTTLHYNTPSPNNASLVSYSYL